MSTQFTRVHPSIAQHDAKCDKSAQYEFRVTRPDAYLAPGCPGHADPSARQGHYTETCCATHAARKVGVRLERTREPLDVQLWGIIPQSK